jgi:hypothetical protein
MKVGYALASGDRPLQLSVNSEVVTAGQQEGFDDDGLVHFPRSSGWMDYVLTEPIPITLGAGGNTITLTSVGRSGGNIDGVYIEPLGGGGNGIDQYFEPPDGATVFFFPGPFTSYTTIEEAATLPPVFRVHMLVTTGATVSSGGLIIFGDDLDYAGDFYCWISQAGHWTIGQQSVSGGSVGGTSDVRPNTAYDLTFLYDGSTAQIFVDGHLEISAELRLSHPTSIERVTIGAGRHAEYGSPYDEAFDFGLISDITIDTGDEVWAERQGAAVVCRTTGGTAPEGTLCKFPFVYQDVSFSECTDLNNAETLWCYTSGGPNEVGNAHQWGNCQCSEKAQLDPGVVYSLPGPFESYVTVEEAATLPPAFRVHMLVTTGATTSSGGLVILGDDMDYAGDFYCWISQAGHWTMGQQSVSGGSVDGTTPVRPNTAYDLTFLYDGTMASIWVDGQLEATRAMRMSHPTSIERVTIGAGRHAEYGSPYDEAFDFGLISDITIDDGSEVWPVAAMCSTTAGNAPEGSACTFPFTYNGQRYSECTEINNNDTPWCYTGGGTSDDQWGNCNCVDPNHVDDCAGGLATGGKAIFFQAAVFHYGSWSQVR